MNINIEQVQRLLSAMGKNPGVIDGIWGRNSQVALDAACQQYGVTTSTQTNTPVQDGATGTFWDSIRYFKRSEFACPCPRCGGFPVEPVEKLVRIADAVREKAGAPATVSSGVRCIAHNAEVGGVANSRHTKGWAMDFCTKGMSATQLLALVQAQPGVAYAYAIDNSFVHMDVVL